MSDTEQPPPDMAESGSPIGKPSSPPEVQQSNNRQSDGDVMKNSLVSVPKSMAPKEQLWKPYDFLFPGGKLAKLIKVSNTYKKNLPIRDMLDKFKIVEITPVINIIGAMETGRGKFYAGVARAAFNTDAVIVDNGIASGIEKFTLRRGVKLIGVAPEGEIKFPKINPSKVDPMELANGHTHLFLVSKWVSVYDNPDRDLTWGGETNFKMDLCVKIAQGKNRPVGVKRCKIVSILIGDATFQVMDELQLCVKHQIPIIVVPGAPLADKLIKISNGQDEDSDPNYKQLIQNGHLFYCNSHNSEDIAQLTHLLLSITPW